MLFSLSPAVMAIASVLAVSAISLIGIVFFFVNERFLSGMLIYLVSLSTGALFGDVFIHIVPELAATTPDFSTAMLFVLGGIVFSFVIEKIVHWRHCHMLPGHECKDHDHEHHHSVGVMSLFGEVVHNFIDGVVIAAAFLISVPVGISTTLAIMLHEIPQEIGDFAVLLHSGYSSNRALLFNVLSAFSAVIGAVIVLAASGQADTIETFLLPFAAGNLLYIAGSDLIPELHRSSRPMQGVVQVLCMLIGIGCMYALVLFE